MNVYLDYAATTPLDSEILDHMLPYFKGEFGNPDSAHAYGRRTAYAVSQARDSIARVLNVQPGEVYFTSGGTEADNWAARRLGKGSVCVSAIEHHAVLQSAQLRAGGVTVAQANEQGIITAQAAAAALGGDTGLVCVMAVNNETGCIQPLKEISALCRLRGALLFSDCVQAACTQNLKEICGLCDAISLSAHKLYGPHGAGALVVKKGSGLAPLISGGEQERGLRGGTLNVAAIVGFSYALERAQAEREAFVSRSAFLRERFEQTVLRALGSAVQIDGENRAPNISHITFSRGESLLHRLDLAGVAASGGAACSAQAALPSHVMRAMGRSEEQARSGIRFSFGKHTTEEEVDFAAQQVIACAGVRS